MDKWRSIAYTTTSENLREPRACALLAATRLHQFPSDSLSTFIRALTLIATPLSGKRGQGGKQACFTLLQWLFCVEHVMVGGRGEKKSAFQLAVCALVSLGVIFMYQC